MPYNMLSKCLIVGVFKELNMIRIENFGHVSTEIPGILEMCNGELYVWNNRAYDNLSTREEMIAKLTEILALKTYDTYKQIKMTLGEYLEIREARLALLCVGEEIAHIHSFQGGPDKIKKYVITNITENGIVIEHLGYSSLCHTDRIEYYAGNLYIWNTPRTYNNYSRMGKVSAMIQIIENKTTKFLATGESLIDDQS
ncbi:MAG: hypothetical protein EZS28_052489 [Streblomastix strix]|uniref:Uncharacterized protein n=1 Tax=Streblomastix strix TaxID=222440 RepID=A0A5J4S4M3_9EUKA|nr:MAG: hypothetical protein EZS28_052489 [Streblomastix strix]